MKVYTSYDFWKNFTTQILIIILHDKRLFTNTDLLKQTQNSRNSCQNYSYVWWMNEINKHVNKPQLPDFGIHDTKSRLISLFSFLLSNS